MIEKGYSFQSETDTEVIVNQISYEYSKLWDSKNLPSFSVKKAIMNAISKLKGTYALCIVSILTPL